MFSCPRCIQKLFRGGAPNCDILSSVVFSGRIILKHVENEKCSRGSGGMLPRKIFENLHAVVVILVFFKQVFKKFCLKFWSKWSKIFFKKFCLKFFAPKSECFTKYDAFCSYVFDYACLGRKAYCYRKGSQLWKKLYSSKICLKLAGAFDLPRARTNNNVSYHYTNQPIWLQYDVGQILSQLFWNNSTYCTCIVWTLYFKNKGSVSKGGFNPSPLGAPLMVQVALKGMVWSTRQELITFVPELI